MNMNTAQKLASISEEDSMGRQKWTEVIKPKVGWFDLNLKEVLKYKDLLFLLVRRDFIAIYKQTVLGPIWFFIQPLFATFAFTILFGRIAEISTDGLPLVLFYISGITLWNYFQDCLLKTSNTFTSNADIFGKVYFPRVIIPISIVISSLIKFGLQFIFLMAVWLYFYYIDDAPIYMNKEILLFPFLILMMAGMGLGLGMIISSLTTKYRDFQFMLNFGVQLLMYASPVIVPISSLPEKYKLFILLNPMTGIIETFRYAFLGKGGYNIEHLAYSFGFTVVVLFVGLIIFNRVQKTFMDTV
jgi:lipopolysaccharide transport system permease protein